MTERRGTGTVTGPGPGPGSGPWSIPVNDESKMELRINGYKNANESKSNILMCYWFFHQEHHIAYIVGSQDVI